MDVEQAMATDPHVTDLSFTSSGSITLKPEQIMVTSEMNKKLMLNTNEPCSMDSAHDMCIKAGGKVFGELQDLVKEDRSLKSGHHAIKAYTRLLELELLHNSLNRSYMGDGCVLLNPLLNTTELSVLECFMTHKGLHVLYDMLRHFQPIFEARHVLRKLVKILQHLHSHKMLVVEHMQCDAPRFCMESFSKLLSDLVEHEDYEVRTMALSFQRLKFSVPRWHPSHAKCWAWGSAAPHDKLHAVTNHARSCKIL